VRRYISDHIEDLIAEQIIYTPNKKKFEVQIEKNEITIK
jgi:hypothetical protein